MTKEQLKSARKKLGWTQKRLAQQLGITQEHVARMENGSKIIKEITSIAVKYLLLVNK